MTDTAWRGRRKLLPSLALVMAVPAVHAESAPALEATLRGAVSSSTRLLDDRRDAVLPLSLGVRARVPLFEAWRLVGDASLGNRAQAGASARVALREAYADWRGAQVDLGVGRQILAWGRADGINPTDSFGARDYTRNVAEDDEQRRGVNVLRLRWNGRAGTVQGVLEPGFTPSVIPGRSRPGVRVERARRADQRVSWGLKFDVEGGAHDASVSYYDGLERLPDLTPLGQQGAALVLGEIHPRVRIWGADFASTWGAFVWRAETAFMHTADRDGSAPFVRNRQFQIVLGAEHRMANDLVVYAQVFAKRVLGFRAADVLADPVQAALARAAMAVVDQASADRAGISLRLSKRWSETWSAELTVLAAWPQRDAVWRPRLVMRPDDQWRWSLAGDLFRGPATSTFGQLRKNSHITLGVERHY